MFNKKMKKNLFYGYNLVNGKGFVPNSNIFAEIEESIGDMMQGLV